MTQFSITKKYLAFSLVITAIAALWFAFDFRNYSSLAATGINKQINYQGKLADASGVSVADGNYCFKFEIYNVNTGGVALWSEEWDEAAAGKVAVNNGVFSAALGTSTAMTFDFNQDALYLQVYYDPGCDNVYEETFSPRKRITAASYAFNADTVDGIHATTMADANMVLALDASKGMSLNSVTTTDSLLVGGYASSTLGFWTQGSLHVGGSGVFDTNLTVSGNATTTGYLTIGTAPTGAGYGLGDLNVKGNMAIDGNIVVKTGSTITLGGVARDTWPASGGGDAAGSFWATTSDSSIGYPAGLTGAYAITIGASAVTIPGTKFEVVGSSYFGGNNTSTGYLTVGTAPVGSNYASGNLNVQNNVLAGGYGKFNNVTTTDTLYVGSYASSTSGFFTQGRGHYGGAGVVDDDVVKIEANSLDGGTGLRIIGGGTGGDLALLQTNGAYAGDMLALNGSGTMTGRGLYINGGTGNNGPQVRIEGGTRTGSLIELVGSTNEYLLDAIGSGGNVVRIEGAGNITTTGYASTTLGLFTQGNLHVGGTASFDGLVSGLGVTSAQQNFWNTTSTWAAYDTNWKRNYNATTTLNGFTPASYLLTSNFGTQFASSYNATTTLNGFTPANYLLTSSFGTQFATSYNATTTLNGFTPANYLLLSTYFATTTWAGGNNNLTVTGFASTTNGLYTQGNFHVGGTASFDGLVSGLGVTTAQQNFWNATSTWTGYDTNFNRMLNATTTLDLTSFVAGQIVVGTSTPSGAMVLSKGDLTGNNVTIRFDSAYGSNVNKGSIGVIGLNYNYASDGVVGDMFLRSEQDLYIVAKNDNYGIKFSTYNGAADAVRMTLLDTGYFGIGDTTPAALFTVGDGDDFQVDTSGNLTTSGNITTTGYASSTTGLYTQGNGHVGGNLTIDGHATTTRSLSVGGEFFLPNFSDVTDNGPEGPAYNLCIRISNGKVGWCMSYVQSSIRYKENVVGMEDTSWLYDLRTVNYDLKADPTKAKKYGLIAEETYDIIPDFVYKKKDGQIEGINYNLFIPVLINELQQQKIRVDELQSQLATSTSLTATESQGANTFTSLSVQEAATFYGTITVYGDANFMAKVVFNKEVEFKDHIIVDKDTAGTAKISAGATSTEIIFAKEYQNSPKVSVTPQGRLNGREFWVSDKSIGGFRINIDPVLDSDLEFDWLALAISGEANGEVAGAQENVEVPAEPAPTEIIPEINYYGCIDSQAINFDPVANVSDNSCVYPTVTDPVVAPETPTEETTPPAELIVQPEAGLSPTVDQPVEAPVVAPETAAAVFSPSQGETKEGL